jgi:hypothetical protein
MPFPELQPINNQRLTLVRYATCWHKSDDESPAMWKLYSQEEKGVAVVTTFQRLADSVNTSSVSEAILGPVEYFDYSTDNMSLPMGLTGRPGFAKRHVFEHEKEVRGMVSAENYPEDLSNMFADDNIEELRNKQPPGINVPVNLDTLITSVVVSPSAQQWFVDLVMSYTKHHNLADRVRGSDLLKDPVY